MTVEIISRSISKKVWDRARIELMTPGSAIRLSINCALWKLDLQGGPKLEGRGLIGRIYVGDH